MQGNGQIKQEKCLDCHENTKELWKDAKNKKVMHKEHVAKQTASCFNCHEPIIHKRHEKKEFYVEASLKNCNACHAEPHLYPKLLLIGEGRQGNRENLPQ